MAKYERNIEKSYAKLIFRGDKYIKERKFEKAIKTYLQVYNFYKKRNNEQITAEVLKKISECYLGLEMYEEALKNLEIILEFSKKAKNDPLKACTLGDIGLVYKELYDIEQAEPFFIQANKIYNELGNVENIVVSLIQLSNVENIKGNLEESIKKMEKARDLALEHGIKERLSLIYGNLAGLSLKLGNIEEFKKNYLSVLDYQEFNDKPQHLSIFLNNTMAWFVQLNLIDDELELLRMNLDVCDFNQLIGPKITCLANLSRYYSLKGDLNKAKECINQALNLAEKFNLTNEKIGIFSSLGLYYRKFGDHDKAIKFYLQSLKLSKRFNDTFSVIKNYKTLARIYEDQEKYSEAYRNYSEALKNYSKISKSIKNLKMREDFRANYKHIPELIEKINDILENKKTFVRISEQHEIQKISSDLCIEINKDEDDLVKSACVESATRMKDIINNNKGSFLETDVRELCRRVYKCDVATTGKEWKLDFSQINDLIKRGCIRDVLTKTIEIDIYGEYKSLNQNHILIGECKAKKKSISTKEIICFTKKINIIVRELMKSNNTSTVIKNNLAFQFIIVSLGGFPKENSEELIIQNLDESINNIEIEFFDIEKFIKCLKRHNLNPKFYNDLKSISEF